MSWRKTTFVIVALIVLLGGATALSELFISMKPEPPRRPETEMKRFVRAKEVKYSDLKSSVVREGRVVAGNEVLLIAEAAGKIEAGEVALRKGASFKKGQLLASIYKDEAELALKARVSRFLSSMTALLPDLKVDFPEEFPRYENFFRNIEIGKELPEIPKINSEKLKIFLSSKNILSEYYGIKQDEKHLKRYALYAPFDGSFSQVMLEVGAYANPGSQIARMIRTDRLEIEVPVENEQSKWIQIGDRVRVFSRDRRIENKGVVVRKADFVDVSTQSRSVFVALSGEAARNLLAGEYKVVEFPGQIITGAMELPRGAVFNSNEVFVVLDGRLKKRRVNVLKWNESSLIFNGLQEGEVVVSEPLINAQENMAVGVLGKDKVSTPKSRGKHNKSAQ